MKIKFTDLPTSGGKIQVSFDGGVSFNDYNVEDVRETGIPLDDGQDYSLIQIKSSASVLKNLNVVKNIKVIDLETSGATYEDISLKVYLQSSGCGDQSAIYVQDGYTYEGYNIYKNFYLDMNDVVVSFTDGDSRQNYFDGGFVSFLNVYSSYKGTGLDTYNFTTESELINNLQGKRVFMKVGREYKPTNLVLDFSR